MRNAFNCFIVYTRSLGFIQLFLHRFYFSKTVIFYSDFSFKNLNGMPLLFVDLLPAVASHMIRKE